ncbi:MAG: hypothetical protein EHM45_08570 [Desulfobacteraceae bacterium]|nr:MAG: hypothetical protein EHM45_08570 [Desulfobacteraceae bacterium]
MDKTPLVKMHALNSFEEQLKLIQQGHKKVTIVLKSGKEYSGNVAEIEQGRLLLTKLVGKEYFDALVHIEDISALESRAEYM